MDGERAFIISGVCSSFYLPCIMSVALFVGPFLSERFFQIVLLIL